MLHPISDWWQCSLYLRQPRSDSLWLLPPSSLRFWGLAGQMDKLSRALASPCVLCTPSPNDQSCSYSLCNVEWADMSLLLLGFYRQLNLASINLLPQSRTLPFWSVKPVSSCCLHRMYLTSWDVWQCLLWRREGRNSKQTEGYMFRSTQCQSHHDGLKVDMLTFKCHWADQKSNSQYDLLGIFLVWELDLVFCHIQRWTIAQTGTGWQDSACASIGQRVCTQDTVRGGEKK